MATFVITNLASEKIHLGDFYKTLDVGEVLTLTGRDPSEVSGLLAVQREVSAGNISFSMTPTAEELASGLMVPPNAIGGDDFQEVAAADLLSGLALIRIDCPVGGGGADDVVGYAVNTLPYKFRLIDVWAKISTGVAGTWELRDEPAGAGSVLATMDSTTAAERVAATEQATTVATPGATKGLFVYRSDSTAVGEVLALIRRES